MFWLGKDFFDNPIVPSYILCKSNKERIGSINCINKNITVNVDSLDEITFKTYLYNDDIKNEYYDLIDTMKYILLPDIGFFLISSVSINSEGTEFEHKEIVAVSSECTIAQKYLETFTINMGTTESLDGVRLYDIADTSKSLLHLVLEKVPNWKIGHIDVGLNTMERSFKVDRQDVYSFLKTDIEKAFECVVLFDTLTNTINIYKEENISSNTNIHVSYNNLLNNASVSCSVEDIKTCLTLTGANDLNIREINMGFDRIYNLDYYHNTEFMSKALYDAWDAWVKKRASKVNTYTTLLSQYQNYYAQINTLTHRKMPDDPESTAWTEYGLEPLKTKLKTYEQRQSVMMKSGWGNSDNTNYKTQYLPVYNTINSINTQINALTKQIDTLNKSKDAVFSQMSAIINEISIENNFSKELRDELTNFIREDELSSDNYVVTSTMTDEERFDMLEAFLEFGNKELSKKAVPQLSFTASLSNLFAMEEFSSWHNQFDIRNYIHVSLRDGFLVKAKLLSISFNFLDTTEFEVTFGNVINTNGRLHDVTEIIAMAQSVSTSVSFNSSYWNQAAKDTSNIGKMLEDGLLSAGNALKSGINSEMVIDERGIFVKTISGDYADKDSIFIGGGRILFTDDNWKSVAMAVGRADVNGESRFGVFADFVIAGYIAGSTIEGNRIIGSSINNGNGTFSVDENGHLVATSAKIKGEIKADTGYIGGDKGFTITAGKIYSGKSTFGSNTNGIYLGTDGIALGKSNAFSVDSEGNLVAKTGTIGGIKIGQNKIYSDNNNFQITDGGQATFKHVTITGVQSGSSFGSIGYNGTTTWGNFGGSSYFGSSAGSPFTGTCVGHIQSISADHINANYLNAIRGDIGTLNANVANVSSLVATKASIDSLNAVSATVNSLNATVANINNIVANKASINDLNAVSGKIGSLEASIAKVNSMQIGNVKLGLGRDVNGLQVVTWVYA